MQPTIVGSKVSQKCFSGCSLRSSQCGHQWAVPTLRKVQHRRTHVVSETGAEELLSDVDSKAADVSTIWQQFASNSSDALPEHRFPITQSADDTIVAGLLGEWEGVTATFSPTGQPQQLPEHYVPEAFREWGVELFDWQSQCSCNAVVTEDGGYEFRCTLRRLMPTVGCEADAVAFTEEHSGSSSSSSSTATADSIAAAATAAGSSVVIAIRADGSHNTGPCVWPSKDDKSITNVQLEHCFMMPDQQQQHQQQRVKVVQVFRHNWAQGGAWHLTDVQLHRERYDGPYSGRLELAGCGGGQPPIAQLAPLTQQNVQGNWTPAAAAAAAANGSSSTVLLITTNGGSSSSSNDSSVKLAAGSSSTLLSDSLTADAAGESSGDEQVQVTLLPLNAWSVVSLSSEGQLLQAEAGLLLDDSSSARDDGSSSSSRMVSMRRYGVGDGSLLEATLIMQQQQ